MVDPLDGTVNYVHGLGLYCVSVALVESGETTCGVIYIPESDELFVAEKGRGAWLNGKPIRVSSCNGLDDALMGYSVPAVNMDIEMLSSSATRSFPAACRMYACSGPAQWEWHMWRAEGWMGISSWAIIPGILQREC